MKSQRHIVVATLALLISGCGPGPAQNVAEQMPTPATGETASRIVEPATTVETLMNLEFMPNADRIWRAVSYVANAEGITETRPETDADWASLRESANALIEAGDELLDTSRDIYGDFDQDSASFQYTPDEIRQLLNDNPEPWQGYIQQMQETTRMTLQAIELRDIMGLEDFGARINGACEGCHADYWYRPPA